MKRTILSQLYLAAALLLTLAACSSGADRSTPVVTVSIPPQQYFVEAIGGDKVAVNCLLDKGGSPESFEPSMAQLLELQRSDGYLRMGQLPFEDVVMTKVTASAPDLPIKSMSDGVEMLSGTHSCPNHNHSHGDEDYDPHTWSSVVNARVMAKNTLDFLSQLYPDNAPYFTQRYDSLTARLDSLDASIKEILEQRPGAAFVVWHPSLSYFARDYGLTQIAIGMENKELSAPALKSRVEHASQSAPTVLLMQADFDPRQAGTIESLLNIPVVTINPLNPDWEAELITTARAIAQ